MWKWKNIADLRNSVKMDSKCRFWAFVFSFRNLSITYMVLQPTLGITRTSTYNIVRHFWCQICAILFMIFAKKDKFIMNIRLPITHWDILFGIWVFIWTFRGFAKSAPPLPLCAPRYNVQILGERCNEGWLYFSFNAVGLWFSYFYGYG